MLHGPRRWSPQPADAPVLGKDLVRPVFVTHGNSEVNASIASGGSRVVIFDLVALTQDRNWNPAAGKPSSWPTPPPSNTQFQYECFGFLLDVYLFSASTGATFQVNLAPNGFAVASTLQNAYGPVMAPAGAPATLVGWRIPTSYCTVQFLNNNAGAIRWELSAFVRNG